jgi:hypothetical protein
MAVLLFECILQPTAFDLVCLYNTNLTTSLPAYFQTKATIGCCQLLKNYTTFIWFTTGYIWEGRSRICPTASAAADDDNYNLTTRQHTHKHNVPSFKQAEVPSPVQHAY